tara:strand:+ start:424 stop:1485 length:1062 start_codon:yes stop_codon:yes gene_type:complete
MVEQRLTKFAYQTLQQGRSLAGLAHKQISTKLMEFLDPEASPETEPMSTEMLTALQSSIKRLEEIDWEDAEQGFYPKTQLFDAPWLEWAARYPLIWLDMPSTWKRRRKKITRDLPNEINPEIYPDYYLQNFHHQTDGYLSEHSASLYDMQVEILFNGTADAMRRRIIAPLKNGLSSFNNRSEESLRILDVATGTGRALKQIHSAFSKAELIGLDLSRSYLKQASRNLYTREGNFAQLIRGNAENMPFSDESMQAVTCVFLLHELPRKARKNVLDECWRVLEPGGVFVLADSIQIADSPEFETVLENFHKVFHEPYYYDYINDNIEERLLTSRFDSIKSESHFMTRVWSANKPL